VTVEQQEEEKQGTDIDLFRELEDATRKFNEANRKLTELTDILQARQRKLERCLTEKANEAHWTRFRPEHLRHFIEEPYVVEPIKINRSGQVLEWRIYVPKMVEFHVGRLERATHSYNVYAVNQYMRWFAEVPKELEDRFPRSELELKVEGGQLRSPAEQTEQAWSRYRRYLYRKKGPGSLQIKKGCEWELIAQILEDGCLPFTPTGVDPQDLRENSNGGYALNQGWRMRDYQRQAWDLFLEYGAIGVYWPFGTGKSQFGLELCDRLRGPKLIIAGGSRALKEQWEERLKPMPQPKRDECSVVVYQSSNEINRLTKSNGEFTLTVFDECHHLPARSFMRLSTIPTKYRLGLTGSPYREDGHVNYIMALTGYPHGLSWDKFVSEGVISLAQVQVHVAKDNKSKLIILDSLLQRDLGKTLIFCDSLELGEGIGRKHGIPWIYGATRDRLDKVQRSERVVISRVGDEGISVPELDTVIEVDFLGGSRAQALQRAGRLQHRLMSDGKEPAVHHLIMTEDEVERYGKRVLAYYDKGYRVDWLYDM
jgi:DNA excision repair protein ERCC-3